MNVTNAFSSKLLLSNWSLNLLFPRFAEQVMFSLLLVVCRFLRVSAMLKHVIDIGCKSVRPSVCPSVTRWYCIKTAERIVMISSPRDSPFILVLCISRSSRNSDGVTACGAAKQRWGVKISQIFDQ